MYQLKKQYNNDERNKSGAREMVQYIGRLISDINVAAMVCITPEILDNLNVYISENSEEFEKYKKYKAYEETIENIRAQYTTGGELDGHMYPQPPRLTKEQLDNIDYEIKKIPKVDKVPEPQKLPYFIKDVPLTEIGENNIKVRDITVGNVGDIVKIYSYSSLNSPLNMHYLEYPITEIHDDLYYCNGIKQWVRKKDFYVIKLSKESEKKVSNRVSS